MCFMIKYVIWIRNFEIYIKILEFYYSDWIT